MPLGRHRIVIDNKAYQAVLEFGNSNFEFVSNFVFRISNLNVYRPILYVT